MKALRHRLFIASIVLFAAALSCPPASVAGENVNDSSSGGFVKKFTAEAVYIEALADTEENVLSIAVIGSGFENIEDIFLGDSSIYDLISEMIVHGTVRLFETEDSFMLEFLHMDIESLLTHTEIVLTFGMLSGERYQKDILDGIMVL